VNKGELIEAVAKASDLSNAQAEKAVKAVIDTISGALKKGDSVQLVGFGTFGVGSRGARTARNPRTGEAIKVKARKVPKFSAGKGLKDLVNGAKAAKPAAKAAAKPAAKAAAKPAAKAAKPAAKAAAKPAAKGKKK